MARGINKVILVGNLGQDPETRYTANNSAVTNITIATSESWTDKQSGQKQERTEWHRVVMFNKLGEIAGQYLRKGSKVYIEGSLRTRKWQDQNGQDRYTTEIVASDMQMLDSRGAGDQMGGGAPMGGNAMGGQPPAMGGYQQPAAQNTGMGQSPGMANNQVNSQPMQQSAPAQQQPYQSQPMQGQQQPAQAPGGFDDFDDDIPF